MSTKLLKLISKEKESPSSVTLRFAKSDASSFEFVGGQYVILNVGNDIEGKPIKRAYSILSSDSIQDSFRIRIKCLNTGKASSILECLEPGQELEYSGPWGKFVGNPEWPSEGNTLVLATDTGITTLLGLVRSKKFSNRLDRTIAVWLKTEEEDFLSGSEIKNELSELSFYPNIFIIPFISDPNRIQNSLEILKSIIEKSGVPTNAFLSGDGNVLRVIQAELIKIGTPEPNIGIEAFFNTARNSAQGIVKV
ncbi:FAD-dependent oxidoreductase [Leptospira sarikeiensis]|uniref:FAD-dependent oxidoreductase n=1 Tax=Leptospira sarikeiensis TaxID=2484943 RepID=A0A4R9K2P4_9LEPT|nr:FAD-dependent oxidoreductase [Leptospira sarikeiensis]TGL58415.1 FAD-dependent oxidoreductase [Leptospira sarikeiensis]